MSDDDPDTASLVMPFLPVTSRGGPWDDDAYAAGWEMGALDSHLAAQNIERALNYPTDDLVLTLREGNREQADLVAMRHGYRAEFQHTDVTGWVYARFTRERQ